MLRSKNLTLLLAVLAALVGWRGLAWESIARGGEESEFEARYGEVFVERESGPLKADLYVPKGEGPFPGVVVVHGGAWRMGNRAQLSGVAQLLARSGMTAVAISYRLAPTHKFPAQIEDCKAAVRWMREQADELKIDPLRLGGFGYSAGAHLVTLLGATDADDGLEGVDDIEKSPSTRLQAVVAGGTPCDFRVLDPDTPMLSFWLGGTRRQVGELYRLASPRAFVTDDDPPMFFFHGENDNLVPMISPEAMCDSLKAVGVPAELYVIPKIGHNFAAMDRTALAKSVEFLTKNLSPDSEP